MFRLQDATRRLICRTGFWLLCVTPTLATVGWCAYWNSSRPRLSLEQTLTQELGLKVSGERITQPRPGVLLLENLQLCSTETGELVARMRLVEATRSEQGWVVIVSQPELDAAQFGPLSQMIAARLREAPAVKQSLRILASEATVRWPRESRTFSDLAATVTTSPTSSEAELQFRVAGLEMAEAARLRVIRIRESLPPTVRCELHTGKTALPVPLLLSPLALENRLGAESRFRGSVWLQQTDDEWQGAVTGELSHVDLRTLTNRFSHLLTGTATVTVQNAKIEHGRLEEALGSLESHEGILDASLLIAARDQLGMTSSYDLAAMQDRIQYSQLALQFSLDAAGLTLQGQCAGNTPGVVLAWGGMPVLLQAGHPTPAANFVRALVPQNEVTVPATQQTDWLNRLLPLPDLAPPDNQQPKGRLRSR